MYFFILFFMIFLHIVDDFYLQGILATLKQKDWWNTNAPQDMYSNDYIVALLCHAFSWSFMIMIPVFLSESFSMSYTSVAWCLLNVFIHAYVDNAKANVKSINLIQDQFIHFCQIFITWFIFFIIL